ncbi:MAG: methyltransferase domain-containing protein [Actinomycetota bacterium]|nr:methyltransferase domain-containing protein [Actinomycetota bacterium]
MTTHEHNEVVRQSFTQQVGLFTGDDSPFARRFDSPLAWIEPLDVDMIVLDVACGAGHAAEQAAPHVRQVVGIDLTPALLRSGAERLRDAGLHNILLQQGDANSLPFVDASFDLVVCRSSLHHFSHPETAVAEMARVCRPGGRVVVSDMTAPKAEIRDAFDALHRRIDPSHVRALLEGELAELLRAVGPITYGDTSSATLPIDVILTGASDREGTMKALHDDLGINTTGFDPVQEGDRIVVTFTGAVVHATRAGDARGRGDSANPRSL